MMISHTTSTSTTSTSLQTNPTLLLLSESIQQWQRLRLAGKSSKSDQMEVKNSTAMQQLLSTSRRELKICLYRQDLINRMAELKGFTLQSSTWFGPVSQIVRFHQPSGQKQHHMQLIYEIEHLASHQTVFQTTYGMARRNHTYTYNHLAVDPITVDMMSFQSWTLAITRRFF
jgi:hypothetical protein